MRANQGLVDLCAARGIFPAPCKGCGAANWGAPGHDDGRDDDYVGFQCRSCGGVRGLSRRTVQRRASDGARGRGRPRTGRIRVAWTMPPDLRAAVEARATAERTTESAIVEEILRASGRLRG